MESYILTRTKDGSRQILKTVGRVVNDGVWSDPYTTPAGCSFNLPLIFSSLHSVEFRCGIETVKDPSWTYNIEEFDR